MEPFFQRIFSVPDCYSGIRRETAKTVKKLLIFLPIPFSLLIVERLIIDDLQGAIVILLALLVSSISFVFLNKNKLTGSVIFLCSIFVILVTVNVTFVHGIHSVAIIAYPAIIVFSSLIIRQGYLMIFSALSIMAIFWLGVGEQVGLFTPKPYSIGQLSDLIALFTILLLALLVINDLASNLKNTLKQAEKEVNQTNDSSIKLQSTIDQKNKLLAQIHVQAKTNIGYILKLLEGQQHKEFQQLLDRTKAIHHVHSAQLISDNFDLINLQQYLDSYFLDLKESLALGINQLEFSFDDIQLPIEQAHSLGIFFYELISCWLKNAPDIHLKLKSSRSEDSIHFVISSPREFVPDPDDRILLDIAVRQLKANFSQSDNGTVATLTLPKTK